MSNPDQAQERLRAALESLPRVSLGIFPTPLQQLARYGARVGHPQLYIKRDDMTGLGMGGNKTRSLEFLLGEALTLGADVVVTAGGLQSNLCQLTAAACARLGLGCVLVHNADPPETLEGNQLLNRLAGIEAHYVGPVDEAERTRHMERVAAELRERGKHPYIVYNGASTPRGALGYTAAALELLEQVRQRKLELRHVGIVGAMGGTASGLVAGAALLGHPFHVHVISVEYPGEELRELIFSLTEGVFKLLGLEPQVPIEEVMTTYDEYLGEGYALPTEGSFQALYDLAREEGIYLELVYTSKTLAGVTDLVRRGVIPPDETVCYVHTGGTASLFAQAKQLIDLQEQKGGEETD